jgi:hypothetical protein
MGSSIPQHHLTWYVKSVAPILKEAERICLGMPCCDAQAAEVIRACFQEFRANLLGAIAREARRWDHDLLVEQWEKSHGQKAVHRVCLQLIKQLQSSSRLRREELYF